MGCCGTSLREAQAGKEAEAVAAVQEQSYCFLEKRRDDEGRLTLSHLNFKSGKDVSLVNGEISERGSLFSCITEVTLMVLRGTLLSTEGSRREILFDRGVIAHGREHESDVGESEGYHHTQTDDDPWRLLREPMRLSIDLSGYCVTADADSEETGPHAVFEKIRRQPGNPRSTRSPIWQFSTAEQLLAKWDKVHALLQGQSFYFLNAARLRDCAGPLRKYQDLMREGGWLQERTLEFQDVLKGTYVGKMLAVSHRWIRHNSPFGSDGDKLSSLQKFLHDHPNIEYVWIDYCCLPQEEWNDDRTARLLERTPEEQKLFSGTLPRINLLYLGLTVVLLVDPQYAVRFWTSFEAFLSFQTTFKYGFTPAVARKLRAQVVQLSEQATDVSFFGSCTYEEAVEHLGSEKVVVTNQSDKEICMRKLEELKMSCAALVNTLGNTTSDLPQWNLSGDVYTLSRDRNKLVAPTADA